MSLPQPDHGSHLNILHGLPYDEKGENSPRLEPDDLNTASVHVRMHRIGAFAQTGQKTAPDREDNLAFHCSLILE